MKPLTRASHFIKIIVSIAALQQMWSYNVSGHPKIGNKIVETLHSNRATSENKRLHTPPLFHPLKVGVFVVFYR